MRTGYFLVGFTQTPSIFIALIQNFAGIKDVRIGKPNFLAKRFLP